MNPIYRTFRKIQKMGRDEVIDVKLLRIFQKVSIWEV